MTLFEMTRYSKILFITIFLTGTLQSAEWKKHVVMEKGANTSAVAADYDGDGDVDVITSYAGKVSLFSSPDWEETVLHRFANLKGRCIHSETLDIDGDGDMDWAGSEANNSPFW
ncbi:MAG: hypothetical protein AAGF67_04835, partial [Verrucomicrobiota bacterium]